MQKCSQLPNLNSPMHSDDGFAKFNVLQSFPLQNFSSLQSRVESAVSTAEKLWREHHQNQVSKLQQQLREATPPGPSPTTGAVERALREAREKWEEEQQAKIQEALDAAKQVHM